MDEKTTLFWNKFLSATGRQADTKCFDCFHFEMNEYWANELLRLVLSGVKRATASSRQSFEAESLPLPVKGNLSIVTDWDGNPRCVIETTAVTVLPFSQMTFELCSREGEDDCLESWRKSHTAFFTEEGAELGYEFSEELPVVFEEFEVIWTEAE